MTSYIPNSDTHITRAVHTGVTPSDDWIGCAVYESAAGKCRPLTAITQRPIGVVTYVDAARDSITICRSGKCLARPNADVDIASQLATYGTKACAAVGGKLDAPAETAFFVGSWDTQGGLDPTEDNLYPFHVDIADFAIPEA